MADPFTLQAHITDACDLACRHCYREGKRQELSLAAWQGILEDFTGFCRRRRMAGRVTFAGGEPLLRWADLPALMQQARAAGHQIHLLTNGQRLTPERARELAAAGCLRVQVSLDGDAAAHDACRGAGTHARAAESVAHAAAAGMHTTLSMTVDRSNAAGMAAVADLARRLGSKLFVSRLVPCGRGAARAEQLLPAGDWLRVMRRCLRAGRGLRGGVALRDPLYARLQGGAAPADACVGGCACGYGGLAVEADGEAYPCRRLPISLGNLAAQDLETIWRSPVLGRLRNRDGLEGECGRCRWRWQCGGCRAIAWATTGNETATDPQCPWAQERWRRMREWVRSRGSNTRAAGSCVAAGRKGSCDPISYP